MKMSKGRRTGITMSKKLGSTLIAMTIIIFMLFLTLGMFTKNFFGNAKADIASAQTKIVSGTLINDNVDEGDTGEYEFHIKNTDDKGNRTQVKMQYKIIVETADTYTGNVTYQVFHKDTSKTDNIGNEVPLLANTTNEFTDNTCELGINNDEVQDYILKFTPDSEGEFNFKVKVESTQVD